jgi:GTPase
VYELTVKNLTSILKKYKKNTRFINTIHDLDLIDKPTELAKKEKSTHSEIEKIALEMKFNSYLTPVISISNKTGYYIDVVKYFLLNVQSRQVWENELKEGSIFYTDSKFNPIGIGLVLSGIVRGDPIQVGTEMLVGPVNGEFKKIRVWSIHNNNKESVKILNDRERGCIAIRSIDKKDEVGTKSTRKGTVVITKNVEQCICYEFTADVEILNHSSVISPYYTPVIHCGLVRQTAKIIFEENTTLKMGDRKEVRFRFLTRPEYIERGSTFFFREGTTRGVGKVKDILLIKDDPNPGPTDTTKSKARKRQAKALRKLQKFNQ